MNWWDWLLLWALNGCTTILLWMYINRIWHYIPPEKYEEHDWNMFFWYFCANPVSTAWLYTTIILTVIFETFDKISMWWRKKGKKEFLKER